MKYLNSKGKQVGSYEIATQSRKISGYLKYKLDGSIIMYDSTGKKLETFKAVKYGK